MLFLIPLIWIIGCFAVASTPGWKAAVAAVVIAPIVAALFLVLAYATFLDPYPNGCGASDCDADEIGLYFMELFMLGGWCLGTFTGFAYGILSRARAKDQARNGEDHS